MPSWKKLITSGSSAKLSALTVDNTVTATAFSGIFQGALSGSAQIKTEISGAFTSTSSSLASRVTSNESIVKGKTILSQSAQIATQISGSLGANASVIRGLTNVRISGSFTTVSSSLASRITTNKGLVSGSFNKGFEFEGKISGSSTSTGSFGRIEVTANTLAIGGTEIDKTVADNITDLDQELNTTSSPTFAGLTTTGDITARNYIVSSSVTYMTSSFSSGSTIFGDDSGDSHKFTGSLLVTGSFKVASGNAEFAGNISGSSTSTGSFGHIIKGGVNWDTAVSSSAAAAGFGTGGGGSSFTAAGISGSWQSYTLVSSSAQIATQISGSLGANASIIRGLTNTRISGSFTDVSSSLASRVKANEDIVKGKTILSQSAQIKDEISGSFTSASSSLAGRISTVEGTGTIQGVGQSDNVTFNKITTTGPDVFAGNVTIGGNLTLIGSQSSATKLTVTDQFGFFASGSEADNLDAGIMVQSGSSANTGSVLYHDVHPVANVNPQGGRWAVAKEFKVDSVTVTPLEYVVTVKSSGDTDDPDSTDVNYGVGEMYINNDGEIFIYTGN